MCVYVRTYVCVCLHVCVFHVCLSVCLPACLEGVASDLSVVIFDHSPFDCVVCSCTRPFCKIHCCHGDVCMLSNHHIVVRGATMAMYVL